MITKITALWRPVVWNRYLAQSFKQHIHAQHINKTQYIILKDLYAIVVSVTNINKSISVHCYSTRVVELSWSFSLCAK